MTTVSEALGVPDSGEEEDKETLQLIKRIFIDEDLTEVSEMILQLMSIANIPDTTETRMTAARMWTFTNALHKAKMELGPFAAMLREMKGREKDDN